MTERVKVFMLEGMRSSRYRLRRYSETGSAGAKCPGKLGYHNALGPVLAETEDDPKKDWLCTNPPAAPPHDDPRWPTRCAACDRLFAPYEPRQVFGEPLYRAKETGEVFTLQEAPAGAMWDAGWWPDKGPGGHCLVVRLPNGLDWMIDGKATNCACPVGDRAHRCWTRKGVPPEITVNPSIQSTGYHGWLRDGFLEEC